MANSRRLFMFVLAEKLGKTVSEVSNMGAREFAEWGAFFAWQNEQRDRIMCDARATALVR